MATKLNIVERNRANAQHSTGPRSVEGKQQVSQNARKLGLFVSDSTVEQEDPQEFAEILADYTAEYCPQRGSETELVRQLTVSTHRLRRLERIESAALFSDEIPHTRHEASVILKDSFQCAGDLGDKIERARMRAERTFNRCYKELEARKARRPAPRTPPEEIRIDADSRHREIDIRPAFQYSKAQALSAATAEMQNKPSASALDDRKEVLFDA